MEKTISLLIDSHHGIYCAKSLVQRYGNNLQIEPEDKAILLAGPNHPWYVETWAELYDAILIDDSGERYFIWENEGDIWAVPDGWEWDEDAETYIEPGETYIPDDYL